MTDDEAIELLKGAGYEHLGTNQMQTITGKINVYRMKCPGKTHWGDNMMYYDSAFLQKEAALYGANAKTTP